jgi:hypothetical protein
VPPIHERHRRNAVRRAGSIPAGGCVRLINAGAVLFSPGPSDDGLAAPAQVDGARYAAP